MPRVMPWSELPNLQEVACLYGRTPAALADRVAGFPAGVTGYALVGEHDVLAAAIRVQEDGSCVLAQLVRAPGLPPEHALPLVDYGQRWARAQGAARLRISLWGTPDLGPLLAARGYALTERFLRLLSTGTGSLPGPLPAGVRPAGLGIVGVERFLAMSNAAFATVPGALPLSTPDWNTMASSPGFREDLLCVLVDDRGPLAFVRSEIEGSTGCIDALAVDPRGRGMGLGRWLLRWSGRALLAQGCLAVDLWVAESNTPALRLYESEGFLLDKARESWERAL